MVKIKKPGLILCALFFLQHVCFGDDKVINIHLGDNIDVSGKGVVLGRTCNNQPEQCSATIPYHGGYYVNFKFKINVNENVHLEDILTAENQSFSAGYSSQNVLKNRFAAFYETEMLKLRAGNLGRIKAGNGLTIDELYSDGIRLSLKFGNVNLDLLQSGAGLVLYEDLYIVQLTDKHDRFGFFANIHRGQTFPVKDLVYAGIFADYPITKDFKVYGEYASLGENTLRLITKKDAYLFGARFGYKYKKVNLQGKLEHRFYDENFNKPLKNLPSDTFFALEEEDKEFNNWWNYLYMFGDDISTLNLRLLADSDIHKAINVFADYEYAHIASRDNFLGFTSTGNVYLYRNGISYYLDRNKKAFLSYVMSNRFLNSRGSGMIYKLYDTNYSSFEFHFIF